MVNNQRSKLIKWPRRQALRNAAERFEDMKGFLGVVGAVHGTHISIKTPTENPNDYARAQHGLSPSGNLINMHKTGKIASVGFNSQLLANT